VTGSVPASAVFAAFDYAARMGAHVVSVSLGGRYAPGFVPTGPAPPYHASWDAAFEAAMAPLADRGALVVAAAGNERIDMDLLRAMGYSYAPCLIDQPNVRRTARGHGGGVLVRLKWTIWGDWRQTCGCLGRLETVSWLFGTVGNGQLAVWDGWKRSAGCLGRLETVSWLFGTVGNGQLAGWDRQLARHRGTCRDRR